MSRSHAVVAAHDLAVEGVAAGGAERGGGRRREVAGNVGLRRIGGSCLRLWGDIGRGSDGSLDRGRGDAVLPVSNQVWSCLLAADAAEKLTGMIQNITFPAELR